MAHITIRLYLPCLWYPLASTPAKSAIAEAIGRPKYLDYLRLSEGQPTRLVRERSAVHPFTLS